MSDSVFCLDDRFSTTQRITNLSPEIINNPEDQFESVLFLPRNPTRTAKGGLRTKGYFKQNTEDKPLISIITVVFNGEQYLEQTIKSVIEQSYDNVEYIIIDGGSKDGTLDIIRRYQGAIDYWVSEPDEGIYDAMNKGVDCAQGSWIFFLGSDDRIFRNNSIELIVPDMTNDFDFIYGNILYTSDTIFKSNLGFKTNFINTCHHQASFYKRSLFKQFRYQKLYKIVSDYELNFFIFNKKLKAKNIDMLVSVCGVEGVSHINNKIHDYFDLFKIRSIYINPYYNFFFLAIGLVNFFRRKFLS